MSQPTFSEAPSVDPKEFAMFNDLGKIWWDPEGTLKGLHTLSDYWIEVIVNYFTSADLVQQELVGTSTPLKNKLMLDVGCGGGLLTEPLAATGADTLGLDINSEIFKVATTHAALTPSLKNLSYKLESVEEHAVHNSNKYDAVVSSFVLEHVADHETFLKSCVKCVKPGGSLFISCMDKSWAGWLEGIIVCENILKVIPRGLHDWNKFLAPKDVQAILEKYDCRVKMVHGIWFNVFTRKWFFSGYFTAFYVLHAIKEK